jgi:hypothetical protein
MQRHHTHLSFEVNKAPILTKAVTRLCSSSELLKYGMDLPPLLTFTYIIIGGIIVTFVWYNMRRTSCTV